MDEFDESGRFDDCIPLVAASSPDENYQQRAQALAAAGDDVVRDLVHQWNRAFQTRADDAIDGFEVRLDERAYFFEVHRYWENSVAGGIHGEPCILADTSVRRNGAGGTVPRPRP
jgi:hypothetical protein